ncbi:MAG: nucleotidyltransferase domain-containing protein [Bacteroides sp.]|nr:nucleotidyltransferase domain-containing protein [Bacteroides sp.]
MHRPRIVELISKAIKEIAPDSIAILYGSEARGTARKDSDFDILVLLPDDYAVKSYAKRRVEIFDKLYEIELARDVIISPLVLLKSMWEQRSTPFTANVMREGIEI